MSNSAISAIQSLFASRLDTLAHLVKRGAETFAPNESYLERRIAPDMAPFGTQIAFTCNQPRNFALWCRGEPADNLNPDVLNVRQAQQYIRETKELLSAVAADDSKLETMTRLDLGPGICAELSGAQYVNEFLIPNFYFHLVTAYDILRMAGVEIGKRDYMLHMLPFVRQV